MIEQNKIIINQNKMEIAKNSEARAKIVDTVQKIE